MLVPVKNKIKGIKGKPKNKSFSVEEYRKKDHVRVIGSITKDNFREIFDVAKDFVKSILEYEVLRKGHMTGISGKKDGDNGGVVIANFDNADFIAPIVFMNDEAGLEFSQVVNRLYLLKSHQVMEGNLELIDPSKFQCLELKNVVDGLMLMIKKDKEDVKLMEIWGI